jgi:nucleoside-diphosphate-sugar epimerase
VNDEAIFVTGATGFLGNRLIRVLLERGHWVRALARPTSDPEPVNNERLQWVAGDLLDRESLRRGLDGCSRVYHLAACARHWARDPSLFYKVNVEGTRNVLEMAGQAGVRRIVFTSTIVVLGPAPPGVVGDEQRPRSEPRFLTEYEESKAMAEAEVLKMAAQGVPVVLVLPTRAYGPGKFTEGNAVSRMIDLYHRGRFPVLLNRGLNVGNYALADDLVQGHLLAMDKGRIGERYILGGENVSLKGLFDLVDELTGQSHLQVSLPPSLGLAYARLERLKASWLGLHPQITPGWVETFLRDWACSSAKAERELGYRITPLREGLRRTLEWLGQRARSAQRKVRSL